MMKSPVYLMLLLQHYTAIIIGLHFHKTITDNYEHSKSAHMFFHYLAWAATLLWISMPALRSHAWLFRTCGILAVAILLIGVVGLIKTSDIRKILVNIAADSKYDGVTLLIFGAGILIAYGLNDLFFICSCGLFFALYAFSIINDLFFLIGKKAGERNAQSE